MRLWTPERGRSALRCIAAQGPDTPLTASLVRATPPPVGGQGTPRSKPISDARVSLRGEHARGSCSSLRRRRALALAPEPARRSSSTARDRTPPEREPAGDGLLTYHARGALPARCRRGALSTRCPRRRAGSRSSSSSTTPVAGRLQRPGLEGLPQRLPTVRRPAARLDGTGCKRPTAPMAVQSWQKCPATSGFTTDRLAAERGSCTSPTGTRSCPVLTVNVDGPTGVTTPYGKLHYLGQPIYGFRVTGRARARTWRATSRSTPTTPPTGRAGTARTASCPTTRRGRSVRLLSGAEQHEAPAGNGNVLPGTASAGRTPAVLAERGPGAVQPGLSTCRRTTPSGWLFGATACVSRTRVPRRTVRDRRCLGGRAARRDAALSGAGSRS